MIWLGRLLCVITSPNPILEVLYVDRFSARAKDQESGRHKKGNTA